MARSAAGSAAIEYRVAAADPHAHLFSVVLRIAQPVADQVLSLPVWIPGSYLVREFAKHLQGLHASQSGRRVAVQALGKSSWRVACKAGRALTLRYQVYAFDASVRTAYLDAQRGFFNGTSLCLRVHGQEDLAHDLHLLAPFADWQAATALRAQAVDKHGFGHYQAAHYDELVDSPVEMGPFWSAQFVLSGVPHRLVVSGASESFDGARLLADTRSICAAAMRFWHGTQAALAGTAPHRHYLFLLHASGDGYGGLEHSHSTALICKRADLPRSGLERQGEGYTRLLGLISHEYFHTWNVKRLRPASFARYDYTTENHTDLLWFFEGFTSYYDDLLLRRAGLVSDASYLGLLGGAVNQLLQTPGRLQHSVAQASFDAWTKYYRPDENTPNSTVSYYTKGALVALCLDLRLRALGHAGLDSLMRALWLHCQGGPMQESDLMGLLSQQAGAALAQELHTWVHTTSELPLLDLLRAQGVAVQQEPAPMALRLGLRVSEAAGVQIKTVLSASVAEQAGLAAGDEWLAVNGWRISSLDELPLYARANKAMTVLVSRDKRVLSLRCKWPAPANTWRLGVGDGQRVAQWLAP